MKHKKIERLIQKKLDREIGPDEKRKLDKHLAQCSDCSLFYTEMVQASKSVRQLTEFYPQTDFNARVLAKLGLRRKFAWSKAAYVFAGGWLAAILFFVYSPLPKGNRVAISIWPGPGASPLLMPVSETSLKLPNCPRALQPESKQSIPTGGE